METARPWGAEGRRGEKTGARPAWNSSSFPRRSIGLLLSLVIIFVIIERECGGRSCSKIPGQRPVWGRTGLLHAQPPFFVISPLIENAVLCRSPLIFRL